MGGLVFLIIIVVGGFIAWACYTPPAVREIQNRQKQRENEVRNAIQSAAAGKQGIVIVTFLLGHPDTIYHSDGTKKNYIAAGPNSAGGWSTYIGIVNSCGKTIKYYHLNVRTINAVGDDAVCTVKHCAEFRLSATGPIPHGSTDEGLWSNFCYSNDVKTLKLESIDVEYMDGTEENISGSKIVWRT